MNRLTIMTMTAALLALASAAVAAEPWEDPAVNAINRLPARTVSIPCPDEAVSFAIAKGELPKTNSAWVISLNGTWDFKWKSATSVANWEKCGRIAVPGCWQLDAAHRGGDGSRGAFDPPLYTNARYPIEKDAPRVTTEPKDKTWTAMKYRNPVARYTTTFTCPWRWHLRRTTLHFDGVSSAFRVRVNGRDVGYAEDSRLPSEFDLSSDIRLFGANTLEVEVYKHCDGSYLEDQDFWRLSGIFRDVYLVSEGRSAPFDLIAETTLSDDLKSGRFVIRDEKGAELKVRDVPDVKLWSAELPYVYMTPIETRWGFWSGCPWSWWPFGGVDTRTVTLGFRKVEIRDSVVYLNGKRVLFKGVNRHEMEPATGYTVTDRDMRRDLGLLKTYNVNAVRTSHYPDAPAWYDLCDREGLMVVCEANVESHGYGVLGDKALSYRKDYEASQVERATRMVATFRNHPSILVWSLGNESGYGPNFKAEYRAVRALDPTRPIQYENFTKKRMDSARKNKEAYAGDEESFTDIECPMYMPPDACEASVADKPPKPFVLCEYAHAMGNSTGDLAAYWKLAEKYPSFQGGFIWDFADQALWKTDARGKWLAYGGDFGDRPNDGNFNCNGIFDALKNPHPGAFEMQYLYRSVRCTAFDFAAGRVTVRNDYLFRTLENFVCEWETFLANGTPGAQGSIDFDPVEPGATATYELTGFRGDVVVFRIYDEGLVSWETFAKPFVPRAVKASPAPAADLGLTLNFWRAPTDNDRGWQMPEVCRVWKDATATQKLPAGVTSELKTSAVDERTTLVDWTLTVPKGLPPIPRVGLTFTVPKTDRVEYFGLGPWENYSDRATGAMLGVHKATVGLVSGLADPKTGTIAYPENRLNPDNYIRPGEQGYRTGCRRLKVGATVVEAVNAPFGFNVWPYPQTMLEGKAHQWELAAAPELTVNVDAAQMGVGGDNSWGRRPHAPFMLGAGVYRLVFTVTRK